MLAFAARERPVVLILDDLHWADTSTTLLLGAHAAGRRADAACSSWARRAWPSATAPTSSASCSCGCAGSRRSSGSSSPAWTPRRPRALVAARADRDVTVAVRAPPARRDRGQPVLHRGDAAQPARARRWRRARDARSSRHRGARRRQGDDLAPARRSSAARPTQVLSVASVVGRQFDLKLLEALLDAPADGIIAALEEASAGAWCARWPATLDRFAFSHALVRETLYEGQSTSRRVRLHRRIGEALEAAGGANPARARLPLLRGARDRDRRSATRSPPPSRPPPRSPTRRRPSTTGARSATLARRATRRCELLLGLGAAELRAGDPAARATFADGRRRGAPSGATAPRSPRPRSATPGATRRPA